jgi:superfamily II DNA or RNA helicase
MTFAVGSLVKARGREWVVLPESDGELLMVRPLGGTEDEVTGIYLPLEPVEPAHFDLPDLAHPGDYRSSRLLRDAVRLGFRSSAGPFRSFARIAVEPRPYQLAPLLMALKLDPVRILIADDVGIGKTIEAALIARELLDRGEVERLAVLCPPQLAEQWQTELRDKFHIEAELVLPGTAARLERVCRVGQSLFEVYPYVIVSMDFIKSDRRRSEFLRTCPELVIVDEAHTCAYAGEGRGGRDASSVPHRRERDWSPRSGGRHQRHQLLTGLAANADRHLIMVTATPHSGNEDAFRSLLKFLDPAFAALPEDLSGAANEQQRRRLAAHFVQRKRGDIRRYLDTDTPFPERDDAEESYKLSEEYKRLFARVLRYARETVADTADGNRHRQRVRWWSALALLRSLASSPAAAAATLRTRAAGADSETPEEADAIGRRGVLDMVDDESAEGIDLAPGADSDGEAGAESGNRRRLLEMAREADALRGAKDLKLQKAIALVESLVREGYQPIVFCRFIPTAEYVAEALRAKLPKDVEVAAVTGLLPPDERETRVATLAEAKRHVLVATDCLSEGINLQEHFNAVLHYDLSWNPTRHEQREGRVDRYGQPKPTVRMLTYYGTDNQIDGIVLNVLIRKHRAIRTSLGISVPVPIDTDQVIEAIFEGLLLRETAGNAQELLPGLEALFKPQKEDLDRRWDAATEREKRSRTMFAQETIKVDEVARELRAMQAAIGSGVEVATFSKEALRAYGAVVGEKGKRVTNGRSPALEFDLTEIPTALAEALGRKDKFRARFELTRPSDDGKQSVAPADEVYLSRTHPFVEGLATYVMDTALDPLSAGIARRCGVVRTKRVERRTTLLLMRFRYHIITRRGNTDVPLMAEDCQMLAFAGAPQQAQWLDSETAEELLLAQPDANVHPDQARHALKQILDGFDVLRPHLDETALARGQELLDAHRRVRTAARMRGVSHRVEAQVPGDVLGVYVYLPAA